ncbi:hypothetical protein [Shimia sp. MMG029]|uniref:hypothetical protein n=1 Tax=Shimia sp. MMG029 TaxID=3021978 RepID=UPI0022FE5EF7|nr:hypothetical protein [Shimia sp. MMG029]MDA5555793.1 hypothetical protein [Shimia sp. MMG029]
MNSPSKTIAHVLTICVFFSASAPAEAGDAEANTLFVEAVQAISVAESLEDPVEKLQAIDDALGQLDKIVSEHPSSNLAVSIITGQSIGNVDPGQLRKQRDILKAEVDDVLAQRAVAAEAKEGHARWVQEVMDCLDSFQCVEDMVFAEQQEKFGTVRALSQIGGAEAMRHGFSDRFDDFLNQTLQQFPTEDDLGRALPDFWYMISPGILQEEPEAVLEYFSMFEAEYLSGKQAEFWRNGILTPARFALLSNDEDKLEGYLNAVEDAGFIGDIDNARDQVFSQVFGASWTDIKAARDEQITQTSHSRGLGARLDYLALTANPEFEEKYGQLLDAAKREVPEFDPETHVSESHVKYLVSSGSANRAAELILSSIDNSSETFGSDGDHWRWIYVVSLAGLTNTGEETQEALRKLIHLALENREDEDLAKSHDALEVLSLASHLLN